MQLADFKLEHRARAQPAIAAGGLALLGYVRAGLPEALARLERFLDQRIMGRPAA